MTDLMIEKLEALAKEYETPASDDDPEWMIDCRQVAKRLRAILSEARELAEESKEAEG